MAKATQIIEKVPVTTYETKVTGVTLTLTEAEARALACLCGSISGSRTKSIRKYADQIWAALASYQTGSNPSVPGFYAPTWEVDGFDKP